MNTSSFFHKKTLISCFQYATSNIDRKKADVQGITLTLWLWKNLAVLVQSHLHRNCTAMWCCWTLTALGIHTGWFLPQTTLELAAVDDALMLRGFQQLHWQHILVLLGYGSLDRLLLYKLQSFWPNWAKLIYEFTFRNSACVHQIPSPPCICTTGLRFFLSSKLTRKCSLTYLAYLHS